MTEKNTASYLAARPDGEVQASHFDTAPGAVQVRPDGRVTPLSC